METAEASRLCGSSNTTTLGSGRAQEFRIVRIARRPEFLQIPLQSGKSMKIFPISAQNLLLCRIEPVDDVDRLESSHAGRLRAVACVGGERRRQS